MRTKTQVSRKRRKFYYCGGAKLLYLTTFARFSPHIGEDLYGEHTFEKIKVKTVREKSLRRLRFPKARVSRKLWGKRKLRRNPGLNISNKNINYP